MSGNDEDAPVIFYHTWKWGTFDWNLESHNSPLPIFIFWMFIGEGSRYQQHSACFLCFGIPLRICWFPKYSNWASKRQQNHILHRHYWHPRMFNMDVNRHIHTYTKIVTSWSCTQQTTNSECAFRCLNNWALVDGPILHHLGCIKSL